MLRELCLLISFYAVFAPIAVCLRLIGRDPLLRRFETSEKTYWQTYESLEDFRSQR